MSRGAAALLVASLFLGCGEGDDDTGDGLDGGLIDSAVPRLDSMVPRLDGASDAAADLAPEVTTKSGKVQGKSAGATHAFLGIPYGKSTGGAARFLPPQPADPWSHTLQATAFGPSCPQSMNSLSAPGPQSEDCLSLNVFRPASASTTSKLPVMVWIHGGAFISGGSVQYDGARLASEGPAIIVTINYRLGVLGFMSHPALDAARGSAPSGNDGLRDQQLALLWVKDNIAAFGGDPDNVTVFGESAGAASACLHMVSPVSSSLAQRYIIQSGSCFGGLGLGDKAKADTLGMEIAQALCPGEADWLTCLRGKSASELMKWGAERGNFGAGWNPVFNPADPLLPADPRVLIRQKSVKTPIIAGTMKNEWGLFLVLRAKSIDSVAAMNEAIDQTFPEAVRGAVRAHYTATDTTARDTFIRMVTDSIFRCPTRTMVRYASEAGIPTYLYSFEEGLAWHAMDVPYVFGNPLPSLGVNTVDPLHGVIQSYFAQFARTGDPNVSTQPAWARYDASSEPHMTLKSQPAAGAALAKADCDFWAQLLGD